MHTVNVDPVRILQALGDRTRLRLLRLLVSLPKEAACLCEFSDSLEEAEYNVSRHLKILRQMGLLEANKDGRWVYHRLVDDFAIKPYYRLVNEIKDVEGNFARDLKRFKSEISERKTGRCTKSGPKISKIDSRVVN